MVEVSRALMRGRSAEQQRQAVIAGFPEVAPWFRRLFPYSRWGAELNVRITPAFFAWLVGPMEAAEAEVDGGATQWSAVKIKRCRYLAESGCAAMCANLCKYPTQAFFTEQLGMPLTMTPNFDDYSCEMVFGKRPPSPDEDPVASQPCLAACATAQAAAPRCHKLD
ncbi:beta-carotene isomerase chloroplastic-like [Micractinium conductrix]|uniref:Beta-carotene isomerase chloroplastic-like n=1 Tax=Micractinium conductrix TaxID=554055 RepID=A0A2P6V245_9CHLO|nr:beta-carotene isomerase chloroplastic-like [Micractinium conductrix]|eukprot:PSC68169.1 beta-carotene isomerase chloroplastic-like [Micractinium conductrix]